MKDVLTKSASHSHGITVQLATGDVGRVQEIVETSPEAEVAAALTPPWIMSPVISGGTPKRTGGPNVPRP